METLANLEASVHGTKANSSSAVSQRRAPTEAGERFLSAMGGGFDLAPCIVARPQAPAHIATAASQNLRASQRWGA